MSLGPSEGTGVPFSRWAAGTLAFGGSSSRGACRPHLSRRVPVHRGLGWPFSVCTSAGLLVVLMESCPQRQRPAPPCLGQKSWVSPALVQLRIWLQASGAGSSGRQPYSARRGFSVEVTAPPHPTPLLAGHRQCRSRDHLGDHLGGLQSKNRGKALPGGQGVASDFGLKHGLLILSCCPPWPHRAQALRWA